MRYTPNKLKDALATYNLWLAESGSNYFLDFAPRNGYQAVDLCYFDLDGTKSCYDNVEAGTSRECLVKAQREHGDRLGELFSHWTNDKTKATRKTAKAVCAAHIDFNKNFFQLRSAQIHLLLTWAKITKYRRPPNANGSIAKYFFNHLQKRVSL